MNQTAHTMTTAKQQLFDLFEIIRRERDSALNGLSQAQETITLLEAEMTAAKYHADLAYAHVADEQGISKRQIERTTEPKAINSPAWINDIWLCDPANTDILGPAEEAWQANIHNPQSAILLVTEVLKTIEVTRDRLTCLLFQSAIQFSAGMLEPACASVNECINQCGTDPRYKDLAGIALYIRGRIFVAMKFYQVAHWDFSKAVFTKGYQEQVKKWQGYCETCILESEVQKAVRKGVESITMDSNI